MTLKQLFIIISVLLVVLFTLIIFFLITLIKNKNEIIKNSKNYINETEKIINDNAEKNKIKDTLNTGDNERNFLNSISILQKYANRKKN